MLFNSLEFLLLFLPVTTLGFYIFGRKSNRMAILWLVVASIAFYGWWDPRYVVLLLGSICANFLFGRAIARAGGSPRLLALGVAGNLALLGWYKYANFFADNLSLALGQPLHLQAIVLPLGISFFTFTQIAYLVDAHRGEAAEYDFPRYLLFASFFPHLIAGPILHHREIMPQFERAETFRFDPQRTARGLMFLVIGLCKKVLVADNLAPFSNSVFADAPLHTMTFFESWMGALTYTLQLYFDFSGYSDIAIGAALLVGIVLPVNFASPYKASDIIEFWRRWHMTLSRFLRDYLYFPLGGNRRGLVRRYANLMVVMVLGGLWHGAGWTFVIWGSLHGIFLLVAHLWRDRTRVRLPRPLSWALTMTAVTAAWVFFRASSLTDAVNIVEGMFGLHGFELGYNHRSYLGPLANYVTSLGVVFVPRTHFSGLATMLVLTLVPICLLLPNSQQWLLENKAPCRIAVWHPSVEWAVVAGVVGALVTTLCIGPSEFLYFNF